MLQDVPGCFGVLQDVLLCSKMFHVPAFIDGQLLLRKDSELLILEMKKNWALRTYDKARGKLV